MKNQGILIVLICLMAVSVFCADKEEWKKRSIYQLLTDRFARNDGSQNGCGNLGIDVAI
jgi:alpha-amylase